jgi:cation transport ATPase
MSTSWTAAATTVLVAQGQIPTAAAMVSLVALGDFIRNVTVQHSRRAVEGLLDSRIHSAWVLRDGTKIRVNLEEIREGEEVVVYPGDCVNFHATWVKLVRWAAQTWFMRLPLSPLTGQTGPTAAALME